jgi:hypothetical protein
VISETPICHALRFGYRRLAIDDWLLAIGYWLLAIGYWLLAMREALDDFRLFSQFGYELFYAVYPNAGFSRLRGFDFLDL